MSRGLANAARRAAPRVRPEPPARPPRARPPVTRPRTPAAPVPTARERLAASFGAADRAGEAAREPAPAPVAEAAPVAALTTRDRIVNRALATPAPAPRAPAAPAREAAVVDLAAFRERRLDRTAEAGAPSPSARGPPAPVVALRPERDAAPRPPPEAAEPEPTADAEAPAPAEAEPSAAAPSREAPAAAAGETPAAEAAPATEAEAGAQPGAPPAGAPPAPEAAVAPPVPPPAKPSPETDPAFQALEERATRVAAREKRHQPGSRQAEVAQAASQPDKAKDVEAQAADERVATMAAQEPGGFDVEAFKRDVKTAIDGMAPPKTLEEADEFKESGKAAGATSFIGQIVRSGRDTSKQDIAAETASPPSPEGKVPKPVTPMEHERAGPPPPDVAAASALPGPRPAEQTDLSAGPREIDATMVEANVTEEQLARANEPEFAAALDARREVREHAETAPAAYRLEEEGVLAQARVEAEGAASSQLQGMHGDRAAALAKAAGVKDDTKASDQQQREDVHAALLDIHRRTKEDVTTILKTLDETVENLFVHGEKAARDEFEADVARKMSEYKADRYGGFGGGALWLKDKFFDLPGEVNQFYVDGRAKYLARMDALIELIAATVGLMLAAAKLRIDAGRAEVDTYLEELPDSLVQLGKDTAESLDSRFDALASDVDAERDELVDTVARKYVESRDHVDQRIEELKEANKGLVSKAIDAIKRVLKTIYELTQLLLRVLLKAAQAIGDIVAHPIRFLENLVGAVKGGLDRFVSRIDVHLQKALLDVLFGELGSAGIVMPKQLDFAGVLDLVLQVLGLTYANVRERVVKRFGEPVVARLEQTVDVFQTLVRDGVAGLWTQIREEVSDLWDLVVGKIKAYIVERVITAGISYIVALLNPAAAFVKACQGIYQIVMFIVERAKQIATFVEAVLDSIIAIARGDVGSAVEKIEGALANGLSLAIGFLARLANLGALSEKVRSIIALVRRPITRAVDRIVFGAAALYRRTVAPVVGFAQAKVQSGKELLKGKPKAEKEAAKQAPDREEPRADAARDGAAPPARAPPAEEAGPLVVHEEFAVDGHSHDLYTGPGAKELILSSNGPTPITAVPDRSGWLTRLQREYDAARARHDAAVAALAANPRARPGIGAARRAVNAVVRRIVARIRKLRPDDSPGASAPGIGDMGFHGQKRTSLRYGPPVWHLESEHIIPFAVGKLLWDAAGELIPRRGRVADRRQTTIMLYKGASDRKTRGHDKPMWETFRSQYTANVRPTVRSLQTVIAMAERRGGVDQSVRYRVEELLGQFRSALETARDSAVFATKWSVRDEHSNPDVSGQTNGARRAEPKPLPADGQIDAAAGAQFGNIYDLVQDDVEAGIGR